MKLLTVGSNALVRRLVRSAVADTTAQICECANEADALAAYDGYGPDFVLMDACLLEADLIRTIRRILAAHAGARVIVLADYNDSELRNAALQAGAHGYVLKEEMLHLVSVLNSTTPT